MKTIEDQFHYFRYRARLLRIRLRVLLGFEKDEPVTSSWESALRTKNLDAVAFHTGSGKWLSAGHAAKTKHDAQEFGLTEVIATVCANDYGEMTGTVSDFTFPVSTTYAPRVDQTLEFVRFNGMEFRKSRVEVEQASGWPIHVRNAVGWVRPQAGDSGAPVLLDGTVIGIYLGSNDSSVPPESFTVDRPYCR